MDVTGAASEADLRGRLAVKYTFKTDTNIVFGDLWRAKMRNRPSIPWVFEGHALVIWLGHGWRCSSGSQLRLPSSFSELALFRSSNRA
jgi:hypothetical protein